MPKLRLKPVGHLPVKRRPSGWGKYDKLIAKFLKSKHQLCVLEGTKNVKASVSTIRNTIRRLKAHTKMWMAVRENRIYFYKLEAKRRVQARPAAEEGE